MNDENEATKGKKSTTLPFPPHSNSDIFGDGFLSILSQHAKDGHHGYPKLMFWCFLAGYSEKFVTDVIGQFEGQAVKKVGLGNPDASSNGKPPAKKLGVKPAKKPASK